MSAGSASQRPLFADNHSEAGTTKATDYSSQKGDLFASNLLALSQIRGVGAVALRALVDGFPNLSDVWEEDPAVVSGLLASAHVPQAPQLAAHIHNNRSTLRMDGELEYLDLKRQGVVMLGRGDSNYPDRFRELNSEPYWLFVDGDPSVMNRYSYIAIVGTRESSKIGQRAAQVATFAAAEAGLGLVSGLAEGIDAAAHEMAARYSMPQIGILGTGIKVIFPKSTAHLRREIISTGGSVISQFLPNENYDRSQFVERNRLQAALATIVAPIEGKASSGTAHTLRFATELKRTLVSISHGALGPDNEIADKTIKSGGKHFDLSKPNDRTRLKELLNSLPGDRWGGFRRPDASILYARVRSAWQEMASFLEATDEEKLALVYQSISDLELGGYELVKKSDD